MKKTLLLLSVMAMAASSASAYDRFTAGTDEAPNYYLIRTERGNGANLNYLTYSTTDLSNGSRLHRVADPTEYSLWGVTPGSAEGTVVVKNYAAEEIPYLMEFSGGAKTVADPTDLYIQQLANNNFSIGTSNSGDVFLDANNYDDCCGNWRANDGGTTWHAVLVDVTNGDDINAVIQGALCRMSQSAAVAQLQPYASIEVVADIINAGIDEVNAVEATGDFQTKIDDAVSATIAQANSFLLTGLAGKTYGILNLRREGSNNAYISVNVENNDYPGVINMIDDNSLFEFQAVDGGGYHIYNKATSTYMSVESGIGKGFVPTTDEAQATTVYPFLSSFDGYSGIVFAINAQRSQYEPTFNYDPSDRNGHLVTWYADTDGAGSIWTLVKFDEEAVVAEITSMYINHLTAYAENVEPCADTFTTALSDIKKLKYSATLASEAEAIETQAIATANESIKTCLNKKSVQLRSLRNGYVIPNETPTDWTISEGVTESTYGYSIAASASDATNYDFVSGADGGYTVYSPVTERYLGAGKQNGGNVSIPQVEAANAALVYPVIYSNGDFYGVAMPLENSDAAGTPGLNTNSSGLHQYRIGDGGSIFAIKVMGESTEITEISAAPAAQGIYDLSGRKLSAPVRGINIINGRKVLVK